MRAVRHASDAPVLGIPVPRARDDGPRDQVDGAVRAALSRQVGASRVGRATGRARVSHVQERRTVRVRLNGRRCRRCPVGGGGGGYNYLSEIRLLILNFSVPGSKTTR